MLTLSPAFMTTSFFPALVHETEFSGTGGFGRGLDAAVLPGQVDRKTPAGAESRGRTLRP